MGKGSLEVICGPMFCGKTEELIRRLRRAEIAEQEVRVFKPKIDNRYANWFIVTHYGAELEAEPVEMAHKILKYAEKADVVGIDEAQFFDNFDILTTINLLIDKGKRVIVSGLDQDYRQQPFGAMPELLAMADSALKLQSICSICKSEATTTQRLIDGKPARYDEETILVGGTDSYEARCRNCHRAE